MDYLPGCPKITLGEKVVKEFMQKELGNPILEELYPRLWLVARRSYNNIDPLHLQRIKGRTISLIEDPQLHLLWQDDRVYIKPVPLWLLNYEVWLQYLCRAPGQTIINETNQPTEYSSIAIEKEPATRKIALGFLRSYVYLIQHYSDFIIAHQCHLLPPTVDWLSWSRFIACFRDIEQHEVSHRYHYGQLRLSRLHWAVRFFHPQSAPSWLFYFLPHWSTTPYLHSILAPLAFVFATLTLVLSAMQVVVSIPAEGLGFSGVSDIGLKSMRSAFWGFSMSVLMSSGVIWSLLAVIPTGVFAW